MVRAGQAIYSQNRDGCEVEQCGRGGDGREEWLHARVLCGCETGCEVLKEHDAGGSEHEDKQSRRCCATIVGVAAARPKSRGGVPPQWSWPGKEDMGHGGQEGSREVKRASGGGLFVYLLGGIVRV